VTSLSESRSELDAMIADIELTLVSIIQGVALTVLIEASREAIAKLAPLIAHARAEWRAKSRANGTSA
jgi:hypothetical protein